MERRTIFLAAGGTGGHIFPAAALAEVLHARGYAPLLVTDKRFHGYAAGGDALSSIPVRTICAGSLSGSMLNRLRGALLLVIGCIQAIGLLWREKPLAVVGFGGYPSFPTVLAAIILRTPTVLHEQNSVLGKVNRALGGYVDCIATSYPVTQRVPARARTFHTGNPVRAAILALRTVPYPSLKEGEALRVLITGGSQGASVFSDVVPEACARLSSELRVRLHITQQVRAGELETVRARYAALGMTPELAPFFTDVAARLASAHLMIGRAGASTMAEVMVAGRPALLVPLPSAADNHQYCNAHMLTDAKAGWVMTQDAFTAESLAQFLEKLLHTPQRLQESAAAVHALGMPDAAVKLADVVMKTAGLMAMNPDKEAV